jgi:predicted metal-dependent phosphoesterase TrpH
MHYYVPNSDMGQYVGGNYMQYIIDLHVHSYMSDGTCSPKEIIELANQKKIKAIALTDHDSIEGVAEAEKEALKYDIKFLKGIEISALYRKERIVHIIGLGMDVSNPYFLESYTKMKKAREDGVMNIVEMMRKKGIDIDSSLLRNCSITQYLDRYTIHRYFMEKRLCRDAQEVWDVYLDPIPYGDGELLEVEEALDVIKKAGGLAFLAHYNKRIGLLGYSECDMEKHIEALRAMGLAGIETYYPSYTRQDALYAEYLINKYHLIPSGGTDFHGENRPNIQLGTGENGFFVPYSIYESIKTKLVHE